MTRMKIRDAEPGDAAAIAAIYNVHVRDTIVTFEIDEVGESDMTQRIFDLQARGLPWLAPSMNRIVCSAMRMPDHGRYVRRMRTVETSIYLAQSALGRGLGRALYGALIERLRAQGMHLLIGGISLPNVASVALHEALGFTHVGDFQQAGYKFGERIDVGYWQRPLGPGSV